MTVLTWHASKRDPEHRIGFPWTWRRLNFVPFWAVFAATVVVAIGAVLFGLSLRASSHFAGIELVFWVAALLFPSEVVRYKHNREVDDRADMS
ncbi:hypothetical protein [Mycobacterium sp. MMS18-G62]